MCIGYSFHDWPAKDDKRCLMSTWLKTEQPNLMFLKLPGPLVFSCDLHISLSCFLGCCSRAPRGRQWGVGGWGFTTVSQGLYLIYSSTLFAFLTICFCCLLCGLRENSLPLVSISSCPAEGQANKHPQQRYCLPVAGDLFAFSRSSRLPFLGDWAYPGLWPCGGQCQLPGAQ